MQASINSLGKREHSTRCTTGTISRKPPVWWQSIRCWITSGSTARLSKRHALGRLFHLVTTRIVTLAGSPTTTKDSSRVIRCVWSIDVSSRLAETWASNQGKRQTENMGNSTDKDESREAASCEAVGPEEMQLERQKLLAEQTNKLMWLHHHGELLENIKLALPKLEKLLVDLDFEQATEDGVYRFYHHSYKVYGLQNATTGIVEALKELLPDRPLNTSFTKIVADGTGHDVQDSNEENSFPTTRAILEAFFHAH